MKTTIVSTVALLLLAAACSTSSPRRQFGDIPLPSGLTYQSRRSVVIESPTVKAAQLVYRGRLEPQSLSDAMRTRLEANGWRPVSRTTTANEGTLQVYEKDGNALEVHIYEGLWYTYMAIKTSEALPATTAQAKDDAAPAEISTAPSQERASSPAAARMDTSIDPPATAADRPPRGADASFTQRVRDFFTNLFSW